MKKWYNFETSFMPAADALSVFLKRKGIYYERSGAYGNYHFEILTDVNGVISINSFLYEDTMMEG